jgi:hypothetical protein
MRGIGLLLAIVASVLLCSSPTFTFASRDAWHAVDHLLTREPDRDLGNDRGLSHRIADRCRKHHIEFAVARACVQWAIERAEAAAVGDGYATGRYQRVETNSLRTYDSRRSPDQQQRDRFGVRRIDGRIDERVRPTAADWIARDVCQKVLLSREQRQRLRSMIGSEYEGASAQRFDDRYQDSSSYGNHRDSARLPMTRGLMDQTLSKINKKMAATEGAVDRFKDATLKATKNRNPDTMKASIMQGSGGWWRSQEPLNSNADWIWNIPSAGNGAPVNQNLISFKCNFQASKNGRVKVHYVCDDWARLIINGKTLGEYGGGWDNGRIETFDGVYEQGQNLVEFQAKNTGGPAGLRAVAYDEQGHILFATGKNFPWTVDRNTP